MFCKNCGSEIEEDALFCTKCGTPIPDKIILENRKKLLQEKQIQEVEFVRKKIKLGIIFIIIPLILLFIFFGLLII